MSYHTWSTDGFGFCVDDIKTTPERVLKLAALNEYTLSDLREYLAAIYEDGYKDEDLEMDDFDDFEFTSRIIVSGSSMILFISLPDARLPGDSYCVAVKRNNKELGYYILEASLNNNKYMYLVNQIMADGSIKLHNKIQSPDEEEFLRIVQNLQ